MNAEIVALAEKHAPVYGAYDRTGNIFKDTWRWFSNFFRVFVYKAGFILCVEGLSKAGVAVVIWPVLNGMVAFGLKHWAHMDLAQSYPIGLALFIEAMILFWWMNKSTAKKFILEFVGPALKDLASAFKR